MKLKAGQILDAFIVLTAIINDQRKLPQKGKFRVARCRSQLETEATRIQKERDEIVFELGEHKLVMTEGGATEDKGWEVPPEKMPEFKKRWDEMAAMELEVSVEPIPLDVLGEEGTIGAHEFVLLGDLVAE